MLSMKYLNKEKLDGFSRYKYNSIDTSILSVHVMHPFWNFCVQFFPRWLAPNLITFTGFLLTVVNFLLIGYYDYHFEAADDPTFSKIPRWVFLVAAFNIFLAYTLDGIDGKQARRTGTSGPLGELFDHGLDSYSAVLIPIYMFSLFGRIDITCIQEHYIVWLVLTNFYFSHFEKYNTGVMFLPWGYDFTMWAVTLVLFATSILGPEIWKVPLPIVQILPATAFEIIMYISSIVTNYPIIIKNIYLSYKNKTGKMRSPAEALRPLAPLAALFVLTTVWVTFSHNRILDLEPRVFFLMYGTIFSNISCRLIVAQMSDTRMDGWNFLLYPLLFATLVFTFPNSVLHLDNLSAYWEVRIVYALTAFVTITQIHYGQGVVREMCAHFKINCFTIKKQPPPELPVDV